MSEIQLDKIQDVTDKQIGAMGSFFDIGSVFVQTAGSNQDVEFQNIPRPRDVHDILSDLLEMQEKGEL
jgi:membrane protein YdbS with pleckstrin-like domain